MTINIHNSQQAGMQAKIKSTFLKEKEMDLKILVQKYQSLIKAIVNHYKEPFSLISMAIIK
jgi:hypothetical protein